MTDTVTYFAYGSNMSPQRLLARTPSADVIGVGHLLRHQLRFHKFSQHDGSGKCDVFRTDRDDDRVYGVLYALDRDELPGLDAVEGVGFGYERRTLDIVDRAGVIVPAETYVATLTRSGLLPLCWYREHVLRGARHHQLPQEYVRAIEAIRARDDTDPARRKLELSIYQQISSDRERAGTGEHRGRGQRSPGRM